MIRLATKFAPDDEACSRAVAAGFIHAELWTDPAVLAGWREVSDRVLRYPLRYAVHFPNRKQIEPETLAQVVGLCRRVEATALVIHQPHYDRYAEALRRLDPRLPLAIENHRLAMPEFYAWAERAPGLTLDVEHLWKYTLADAPRERLLDMVEALLDRHGDKLRHVHLPGYLPGYDEHRPMYSAREMVFPVLDLLADRAFAGLVVSEIETIYQTENDLRMDVLLHDTWQRERALRRRGQPSSLSSTA